MVTALLLASTIAIQTSNVYNAQQAANAPQLLPYATVALPVWDAQQIPSVLLPTLQNLSAKLVLVNVSNVSVMVIAHQLLPNAMPIISVYNA
jgi:hypothetical protein